jgi:hypothetical protein
MMIMDELASRIADWAMKIWRGDRTVINELKKINKNIEANDNGIVGSAPDGMRVGIQFGLEPSLAVVQLGFLLFGQLWPLMPDFDKAMKEANKMWRQEVKARKVKAEAMSP